MARRDRKYDRGRYRNVKKGGRSRERAIGKNGRKRVRLCNSRRPACQMRSAPDAIPDAAGGEGGDRVAKPDRVTIDNSQVHFQSYLGSLRKLPILPQRNRGQHRPLEPRLVERTQ
jgi:hypothetical protein